MSEENQQQPAETGASEQPAPIVSGSVTIPNADVAMTDEELAAAIGNGSETIVGASASDLVTFGTTGDVIAAPVLETLTGGMGEDAVDAVPMNVLDDILRLRTAHDAIEALLACAIRLRVLDRLEPDTHAKATGALADLKARLGL